MSPSDNNPGSPSVGSELLHLIGLDWVPMVSEMTYLEMNQHPWKSLPLASLISVPCCFVIQCSGSECICLSRKTPVVAWCNAGNWLHQKPEQTYKFSSRRFRVVGSLWRQDWGAVGKVYSKRDWGLAKRISSCILTFFQTWFPMLRSYF